MRILVIALLFSLNASGSTIRLLTWWDYISPATIKNIEKAGYKIDLTVYKSNEVAFSRIISKGSSFDVIIVSGALVNSLEKVLKLVDISKEFREREYIDFLSLPGLKCVPYLWSTTVFSVNGSNAVKSLDELIELKKNSYDIAIIDDPFEVVARVHFDKKCDMNPKSNFEWPDISKCEQAEGLLKKIKPDDFKSSTADFLVKEKSAAYGWHGELSSLLSVPSANINLFLPVSRPVIAADYVCLVSKKNTSLKNHIKFIELLTNLNTTKVNASELGYFSPYKNHKVQMHKKFQAIHDELLQRSVKEFPFILTEPPESIHKKINKIWQKARYEKK